MNCTGCPFIVMRGAMLPVLTNTAKEYRSLRARNAALATLLRRLLYKDSLLLLLLSDVVVQVKRRLASGNVCALR